MTVAYLVSQYPALSHAFIEREIAALRADGVVVETTTVRRCPPAELRSEAMRLEDMRTANLLGSPLHEWVTAHGSLLRRDPAAWAAGLKTALHTGPPRPRARLWQVFYFAESVLLIHRLQSSPVRHVHAHFANNGADIARLAAVVGNAQSRDGEQEWSWSFSMHGPTEFADPVGYDLAAKTRQAGFVACISEYCRDLLLRLAPEVSTARLPIVRMGVDVERFPATSVDRVGRPPGPLRVLFVGRLVHEKAPDVLLTAVARLQQPVDVVLIGTGPLADLLADTVRSQGLEDRVRLLGGIGQDDLPGWYRWADVFCLPSRDEGVPVVLMEAMACELPVVTTRITGIPELVTDGVNGLLVAPDDVDALAAALATLGRDGATRQRLGQAGRRTVVAEFTAGPNARLLEQHFAAAGSAGRPEEAQSTSRR